MDGHGIAKPALRTVEGNFPGQWAAKKYMKKPMNKQIVIKGLKEALYITNIGYPYYGVPTKIRKAIKYLTSKRN